MEFVYNGDDGVFNFTCREGGVRLYVRVWIGQ